MKTPAGFAGMVGAAALLLGVLLASGPARADINTVIVIDDQPVPCKILKHDEKSVTIFLIEAQTPVVLKWDDLAPIEKRRLQRLVSVEDEMLTGALAGKMIDGVEITLASSMSYRGIELTDRQSVSHRFFRFPGVPFMAVAKKDLRAVKPIKINEALIFSAQERYKTQKATTPPQTAEDYFRLGKWCLDNELVAEANDNFSKCQLLAEDYAPRCAELKPALDKVAKTLQARQVYNDYLVHKSTGAYGRALKAIDLIAAQYPDFNERTKMDMERPLIEKKRAKALRREVISLWYMYTVHFVDKCASMRISETPAVPVKLVYLTSGFQFEGVLKSAEDAAEIILENAGRTYSVKRELIARMDQKLIENGPWRERTLAECRKYVTDAKGGITADIVGALSKELGIPAKGQDGKDPGVLDIWEKRLSDNIIIDVAGLKDPEIVAAYQDAHWSVGSWLRATGGAGGAGPGATTTPGRGGGSTGGGSTGGTGGNTIIPPSGTTTVITPSGTVIAGNTVLRPGGGNQGQPQQIQWKDPETWWSEQAASTKYMVLMAMCAEQNSNFKVEKVYEENCIGCGGTGKHDVMVVGAGGGGEYSYPCSVCRGSGRFYGVSYR